MAEELAGIQMVSTSSSSADGLELLRNDSKEDLHIRYIGIAGGLEPADAAFDEVRGQIGKNIAFDTTSLAPGVKCQYNMSAKVVTSGKTATQVNRGWYFARGQFPLETGEALNLNTNISGSPSSVHNIVDVHYHF